MTQTWTNWSGSLRFTPQRIERPHTEDELAAIVRRAHGHGQTVRVVGSSHSSTPLYATDDILVTVENFQGIRSYDRNDCTATVGAGTPLTALGQDLLTVGLGLPNFGDVATQTVAGALGTGTHGTGPHQESLSSIMIGGRLISGHGEAMEFSEDDSDFVRAARVSLGVLGIFTELKLKLVPAYKVQRQEWCATIDACMDHLDELIHRNRDFDFYWYPRSDQAKLRLLNPPGGGQNHLPYAGKAVDTAGWAHQIIPKHSNLPFEFDEMEYMVPAEAGPPCFLEVRKQVLAKFRRTVGWRLMYRTVAADNTFLSPEYGRASVAISLHQNAGLPFWDYFGAIEPIFRAYHGRPHWGKKHTLRAAELKPLYPKWDDFLACRRRVDSDGVFLNSYLQELLGVDKEASR